MDAAERQLWATRTDVHARAALVDRYLPLVHWVAHRFDGDAHDDLAQVAIVGLLKAINRFDVCGGCDFATFAVAKMAGEIRHHLRDNCWAVRVPRDEQAANSEMRAVASLDDPDKPVLDAGAVDDEYARVDERMAMDVLLDCVHQRHRALLRLRLADYTTAEIAIGLRVTPQHVNRMSRQADAAFRLAFAA